MMPSQLDVSFARSYFPSLNTGYIFMDNAGGSQTLRTVVDRMSDYLLHSNVQHGASYEVSQLATNRVYEASQHMRAYVNASHVEEIVMGPSTSMLIRILSLGLSQGWEEGDEVIVTNTDHEANVSPWTDLQSKGINVKIWKCHPDSLELDLNQLEKLMTPRTKLVAVTHTSNVLGTINPIKEIAEFVHQKGALICVDGVAYAPHRLPDVQDLDVDFYIFSWYKVFGPHYALMYGRKEFLEQMQGLNHYFIQSSPYKFQPGNVNFELAYSLMGVHDYLNQIVDKHLGEHSYKGREVYQQAFKLFADQESVLAGKLLEYLNGKEGVRIIGKEGASKEERVSTVSFVHEKLDSKDIVEQVDPHSIGIRFGDFYAKKLIQDLGIEEKNGVVRVSLVHYNTLGEVEKLIQVLETQLA